MDPVELHRYLLQPTFYPDPTSRVGFKETHASRLYLLDHHVYKLKKAVDFGFLDFSTLPLRRHFCQEEVRLNRHYCPDTYLGVVPLCDDGGQLHLGPPGKPVEYLVRMRRLPEARMLNRLLAAAAPELTEWIPQLGRRLAELHLAAPVCRGDGEPDDAVQVRRNNEENLQQSAPYVGRTLSPQGFARLQHYLHRFLAERQEQLRQRQAAGWVRECHGDLHADHICLTTPLCIYDCIEFNRRLRVGDILADIAFLLMDLDRYRRHDLSALLWQAYQARLAADAPAALVRLYKIYRACVRGKVASFMLDEDIAEQTREQARREALDYFNLALGAIPPPALLLTCGLMGVGKSRIAAALAPALRARLIRSDELRLASKRHPEEGRSAAFGTGPYAADVTARIYRQLAAEAQEELAQGRSVVLDASFSRRAQRQQLRQLAQKFGVPLAILHCTCPRELTLNRLRQRQAAGQDPSDGRPELYDRQAAAFEQPTKDEPALTVDTSGEVDYTVNDILGQLPEILGED